MWDVTLGEGRRLLRSSKGEQRVVTAPPETSTTLGTYPQVKTSFQHNRDSRSGPPPVARTPA
jgi:hypothetical protein